MAETVVPVVHRTRADYRIAVALHTLGATLSAAAMGAALGAIGALLGLSLSGWAAAAVILIGIVYGTADLLGWKIPRPQLRRQVPEWWRTFFSPGVAAFLYGLGLGPGFATYVSFGTLVVVGAAALASGTVLAGMLLCAPFGAARGLSVLIGRRADPDAVVERLSEVSTTRTPAVINGVASLTVVAAILAA
jgi:hypothetical protein